VSEEKVSPRRDGENDRREQGEDKRWKVGVEEKEEGEGRARRGERKRIRKKRINSRREGTGVAAMMRKRREMPR